MKKQFQLCMIMNMIIVLSMVPFDGSAIVASQSTSVSSIISFCAGYMHSCVVFGSQDMKCMGHVYDWGLAMDGNVGDEASELGYGMPYVDVGSSAKITKAVCGFNTVCVLLTTKQARCLGQNADGQAGTGSDIDPIGFKTGYKQNSFPDINFGNGLQVFDVAAGYHFFCVILTAGKVKCIGRNNYGQLGYGHVTNYGSSPSSIGNNLPFVDLGTDVAILSIFAGSGAEHTCVILSQPAISAERIKCWGFNYFYQLGYGDANCRGDDPGEMGDNLTLIDLGIESRVKQLALGNEHTCAILKNDELKCWGNNGLGQIGLGSSNTVSQTGDSIPFVLINSGKKVRSVSAGTYHTCISYNDQITMKCMGENAHGQLGQGDVQKRGKTLSTTLANISAIDLGTGSLKISSIVTGSDFSCAVFENNSVKCFGVNYSGQLGIGTSTSGQGDDPNEMGNNLPYMGLNDTIATSTLSPTSNTQPGGVNAGMIVGIVIGVVALLVLAFFIFGSRSNNPSSRSTAATGNNNNRALQTEHVAILKRDGNVIVAQAFTLDENENQSTAIPIAIAVPSN